MELRVPFEHQGHDNRTVPTAVEKATLKPNERLARLINAHLAETRDFYKAKKFKVSLEEWLENAHASGYKVIIRQKTTP